MTSLQILSIKAAIANHTNLASATVAAAAKMAEECRHCDHKNADGTSALHRESPDERIIAYCTICQRSVEPYDRA